jgi:hypothetical protein
MMLRGTIIDEHGKDDGWVRKVVLSFIVFWMRVV